MKPRTSYYTYDHIRKCDIPGLILGALVGDRGRSEEASMALEGTVLEYTASSCTMVVLVLQSPVLYLHSLLRIDG